ncbi:WD40-repeat-containing domain protein [Absidia repens]|uniref:ASTRA-associated protein 1 n=1 Tax=Absidia repens TaxID=90262 RepID=A0A1X2IV82_9FUNG|nr:WD40-repeat-containing domain protein [Absidia repens]
MQRLPPQADYIFRSHQDDVNFVRFFNNDNYLASCDASGVVIVWLFRTRRPLFQWKAHSESCLSVHVYSKDKLVSQGRDNTIHIWQLDFDTQRSPQLIYSLPYYSLNYCQLSLTQIKGDTMICFASQGDKPWVDIFNLTTTSWFIQNIGDQDNEKRRLCMAVQMLDHQEQSPVIRLLAGYENGQVVLWQCDLETKAITLVWQASIHEHPVLCLKGTVKGGYVLSGSIDNQIVKYDLDDGKVIKTTKAKKSGTSSLAIRKDNKIWATGGYDGRIRVYSVKTMNPLAILSYHRDSVYCVDFAVDWMEDDGKAHWLVATSKDHRISLWNIY